MKRAGYLYEKIYDMENLKLAHLNAKKGKSDYAEVRMVDKNPELYLARLQQSLIDKSYHTGEYKIELKKDGPKERLIYKLPYYPDRICQWAILQVIEPYLMRNLIQNTFSAIPGRGTALAHKRVETAIRGDPVNTRYCLSFDIHKFYPSVDHTILKSIYRRMFKDKDLLWLLDEIIDSVGEAEGIPIGNYLSQYSGNLYLSALDHWILEQTDAAYYFRYMDDGRIFHESKEYLHEIQEQLSEFVEKNLNLKLKDNWQVFPVAVRGVDFVGYRMFPEYTLLRKSICKSFKRTSLNAARALKTNRNLSRKLWCGLNSYKGWLIYCDAYRLKKAYYDCHVGALQRYHKEIIKGELT